MQAKESSILDLLSGHKQFIVPIYQRKYRWKKKHCEELWNDIVRVIEKKDIPSHFIGSVVYISKGIYHSSSIPQLFVIDGQQRLTTISLLLHALGMAIEEQDLELEINRRKIENYYLFNSEEEGDYHYKLSLIKGDNQTLFKVLKDKEYPKKHSKQIVTNHNYFVDEIKTSGVNLHDLFVAIKKLTIVDISLDREKDHPQLIFESLNSKGLDLDEADLIRNYILMGQPDDLQKELYEDYWQLMEERFSESEKKALQWYLRNFLTYKTGVIPKIGEIYDNFKDYRHHSDSSIEEVLSEIYKFSKYYTNFSLLHEEDKDLKDKFAAINTLQVTVSYPFLLRLYSDYDSDILSKADFLTILDQIENYVFRRAVCDVPTNSLNNTFAFLYKRIDTENYVESVLGALQSEESYKRFPRDEEFKERLQNKDLYNFKSRSYWLRKMENIGRKKETVEIEDYTIEHIMPQNKNLSDEWREALGGNFELIQEKYIHTLGNLTLTGYNSELSDRPFLEKRDMEGGFADSPIRLNHDLANVEIWNKEAIKERANKLSELAATIWTCKEVSAEFIIKKEKPISPTKSKANESEIVEFLGGGKKIRSPSNLSYWELENGDKITIKYSKYYEESGHFWYGIHPGAFFEDYKRTLTHVIFVMGDQGIVRLSLDIVEEYLKSAKTTKVRGDPTKIRIYHLYITGRHNPRLGNKDLAECYMPFSENVEQKKLF